MITIGNNNLNKIIINDDNEDITCNDKVKKEINKKTISNLKATNDMLNNYDVGFDKIKLK